MEKEFIPYEWALKLKELEFGSKNLDFYLGCFAYYGGETSNLKGKLIPNNIMKKHSKFNYSEFIIAPTWQQGFDFFREKHGLHYGILDSNEYWVGKKIGGFPTGVSNSYEEARLECLKKLIELVE